MFTRNLSFVRLCNTFERCNPLFIPVGCASSNELMSDPHSTPLDSSRDLRLGLVALLISHLALAFACNGQLPVIRYEEYRCGTDATLMLLGRIEPSEGGSFPPSQHPEALVRSLH